MAVTKQMLNNAKLIEQTELTDGDLNSGADDDTQVSAGSVGEFGVLEVGTDGRFSQYDAVWVGQPQSNPTGDVKGNEVYVDMESGSSDVSDSAQWAIAGRRPGQRGTGAAGNISGWIKQRDADNSSVGSRPKLPPSVPLVTDGNKIQFLAKDESSNLTVDLSESTIEIPVQGIIIS